MQPKNPSIILWYVCVVGTLLAELADDKTTRVEAVTSLGDEMFVLRQESRYIDVYDADSLRRTRRVLIAGLQEGTDMTSCTRHQCVYIADYEGKVIFRLTADNQLSKWTVSDGPSGVSVTSTHNLLVTCSDTRRLKEFTSDGRLVREIVLERNLSSHVWHSVQLSSGLFAVSYGGSKDDIHKVCTVNSLGQIAACYGGTKGSKIGQVEQPVHLAKTEDSVLVACLTTSRVIQLSMTMDYVGTILTQHDGLKGPFTMHFDEETDWLYVADNSWSYLSERWISGNVKVFRLNLEQTNIASSTVTQ